MAHRKRATVREEVCTREAPGFPLAICSRMKKHSERAIAATAQWSPPNRRPLKTQTASAVPSVRVHIAHLYTTILELAKWIVKLELMVTRFAFNS